MCGWVGTIHWQMVRALPKLLPTNPNPIHLTLQILSTEWHDRNTDRQIFFLAQRKREALGEST